VSLRAWAGAALLAAGLAAAAANAGPQVVRVGADGETPVRAERYTARDGTYRMPFPALGPRVYLKDTMVNPNTAWAEFSNRDGTALFVVSMRLVEGPRDARELESVRRRYADFSRQLPQHFSESTGTGRFGPTYGFTLLNAEAVTGYPLKLGYRPGAAVESAAAHRFFVHGGVLYEIAALVQRRGDAATLAPAALGERAEGLAEAALQRFEPLKPTNAPERK